MAQSEAPAGADRLAGQAAAWPGQDARMAAEDLEPIAVPGGSLDAEAAPPPAEDDMQVQVLPAQSEELPWRPLPLPPGHLCSRCSLSFEEERYLRKHMTEAHPPLSHPCLLCVCSFKTFAELMQHLTTHSERKFICTTCGKSYARLYGLKRHAKTHQPVKPYRCSFCERGFAQKGTLRRHLRTHTGARPFVCGLCDKAFRQRSHLHVHERTHTGERPFPCPECPQRFSEKAKLQRHRRSMHRG